MVQRESSAALSQGFRLGFLGTLHMDVLWVAAIQPGQCLMKPSAASDSKTNIHLMSLLPPLRCHTRVDLVQFIVQATLTHLCLAVVFQGGRQQYVSNPSDFPDVTDANMKVVRVEEPMGEPPRALVTDLKFTAFSQCHHCRARRWIETHFSMSRLMSLRVYRPDDGPMLEVSWYTTRVQGPRDYRSCCFAIFAATVW